MMEADGFQVVSKKKAARKKHLKKPQVNLNLPQDNVDECVRKILDAKDVLQSSGGYNNFEHNLNNITRLTQTQGGESYKISSLVCYGLGLPSSSRIAKYQTALLLILRNYFNVEAELYDPLFTSVDTRVLQKFNFHVLSNNEEGKRSVKGVTLFFMPHCGKELYNNLLWANWNPVSLPLCIIIGNSFSSMVQNTLSRILKQQYKFIYLAESLFKEYPLEALVGYDDIFNDMSLHIIPEDLTDKQNDNLWCDKDEPKYVECGVEIVLVKAETSESKIRTCTQVIVCKSDKKFNELKI
ncbi:SRR1-like protein [Homarus americanus]|uniref:SRR1-like protein n=1 Tax=Homarus americanus TaxID=6706 RepID=UPI001C464DFE|nr:SRR1-like protein [Homarus americanus]